MKLDDGRLTFVAQQEVTALDAIHKAALGKAACAGRVTEGVGTCISIHAPTWGATLAQREALTKLLFQSTHPRGVRPEIRNFVLGFISFQSTHPRGVRRWNFFTVFLDFQISIHAPTWGATPYEGFDRESEEFQSTHPRGVRLEVSSERRDVLLFQSTHPRGVRP